MRKDDNTMLRKKDWNYFDSFVELAGYSCKAASLLSEIMRNYDADQLTAKMKEMHAIEHAGDEARHKMIRRLAKEFITPIEREDIMALADYIDTVTDTIEDVLMRMYMYNISEITPYALKMADIVVKCCNSLSQALDEFHNFRKSKKLYDFIIEVNRLEEEGDALFTEATRDLYLNCQEYKELAAWDTTYHYLEKCSDACEDVANVIENVIMKNS